MSASGPTQTQIYRLAVITGLFQEHLLNEYVGKVVGKPQWVIKKRGRKVYPEPLTSGDYKRAIDHAKSRSGNPKLPDLYSLIRPGDRVTVVDSRGGRHVGKAVMRGPAGWVLNMGGRHGKTAIAHRDNVVGVKPSVTPRARKSKGNRFKVRFWTGPSYVEQIAAKARAAGYHPVVGTEHIVVESEGSDKGAAAHNFLVDMQRKHGTDFGLRVHNPDVSKPELLAAIRRDQSDLEKYRGYVRKLRAGGKVSNLTLEKAEHIVSGLESTIATKKKTAAATSTKRLANKLKRS